MQPQQEEAKDRISRRRMLKRIGAGATIAWSAPVLTSLRTPAFAQASGPCAGQRDCIRGCTGELPCNQGCFCMQRHSDKACVCIGQGLCAVCTQDSDCDPITGPGSTCVDVDQSLGCCSGISDTACQPPCGTSFPRSAGQGRRRNPAR